MPSKTKPVSAAPSGSALTANTNILSVADDLGSLNLVESPPNGEAFGFCVLDQPGRFDDGGVGDLRMVIDMQDNEFQRRYSVGEYKSMAAADKLPRSHNAKLVNGNRTRFDQKNFLARLLFTEDPDDEDRGPSESFFDKGESGAVSDDRQAVKRKTRRLQCSCMALELAVELQCTGGVVFCLLDICKRRLQLIKQNQIAALRAANLAIQLCGTGTWSSDDVLAEASLAASSPNELAVIGKTASSTPKLSCQHPDNEQLVSPRCAELCLRAALLQKGNVLQAQGKYKESRECYTQATVLVNKDHRCIRVDWERHSLMLNTGNAILLEGKGSEAKQMFAKAEALGREHIEHELGSSHEGQQMVTASKVALARAFKIGGDLEGAKKIVMEMVAERQKQKTDEGAAAAARAAEADDSCVVAPTRF